MPPKVTKGENMNYRHGDLCIKEIEALPKGLTKLNHNILAEGEVTGHAHRLEGGKFQLYEDEKGILYFTVEEETKVNHEEHGVKPLREGIYFIDVEEEFNPFTEELRKVRD